MSSSYLILGASGGLGTGVLSHLLSNCPPGTTVTVASTREAAGNDYTARGIPFIHTDYNDATQLASAFKGVHKLLFISANTWDNDERVRWHGNIINAAKAARVGHVYYTSLAWGGHSSESQMDIQIAHYSTEEMLAESGISYTAIREGIYADSFPLFMNWYPGDTRIYLPNDGPIAFAARAELAEATAKLMMMEPGEISKLLEPDVSYPPNIVLLTGPRTYTLSELAEAVSQATGTSLAVEKIPIEDYVKVSVELDKGESRGSKPDWFFRKRVSWYEGLAKGDGKTVDPLMEKLLGRTPLDGKEAVKEILRKNPGYRGHWSSP